jgi:hypothetical protein
MCALPYRGSSVRQPNALRVQHGNTALEQARMTGHHEVATVIERAVVCGACRIVRLLPSYVPRPRPQAERHAAIIAAVAVGTSLTELRRVTLALGDYRSGFPWRVCLNWLPISTRHWPAMLLLQKPAARQSGAAWTCRKPG